MMTTPMPMATSIAYGKVELATTRDEAVAGWLESYNRVATNPEVEDNKAALVGLVSGNYRDHEGHLLFAIVEVNDTELVLILTIDGGRPRIECRPPDVGELTRFLPAA